MRLSQKLPTWSCNFCFPHPPCLQGFPLPSAHRLLAYKCAHAPMSSVTFHTVELFRSNISSLKSRSCSALFTTSSALGTAAGALLVFEKHLWSEWMNDMELQPRLLRFCSLNLFWKMYLRPWEWIYHPSSLTILSWTPEQAPKLPGELVKNIRSWAPPQPTRPGAQASVRIIFFLAVLHGFRDLSSPTRAWTCALCSGSTESTTGPSSKSPGIYILIYIL